MMLEPGDAHDSSVPLPDGGRRAVRSPRTFERSPTTFARSRESLSRHPLDAALAFLRWRFGSGFLLSSAHLFLICGKYGLLVGAVLVFVQCLQKAGGQAWAILIGISLALLILVFHYIGGRFLFVLERWDRQINGYLSSSVVPDALSLLSLVGSSAMLVVGAIDALITGSFELVFWGVAVFIWGLFVALQSLNLEGMNLQVSPELSPADEILGLIQFGLKILVRLTPVVFGVMVLVGNLQLVMEIIIDGPELNRPEAYAAVGQQASDGKLVQASLDVREPPFRVLRGRETLVMAGVLPGAMYLIYVLGHFASAIFSVFLAAVPENARGGMMTDHPGKNDSTG